jgi:hypothetical protein
MVIVTVASVFSLSTVIPKVAVPPGRTLVPSKGVTVTQSWGTGGGSEGDGGVIDGAGVDVAEFPSPLVEPLGSGVPVALGVGVGSVFSGVAPDDSVWPAADEPELALVLPAAGLALGVLALRLGLEALGLGLGVEAPGLGLGVDEARLVGLGVGLAVDVRGRGLSDGDPPGVTDAGGFDFRGFAALASAVPDWVPFDVCEEAVLAPPAVHVLIAASRCAPAMAPDPAVTETATTNNPSAAVWARPRISSTRLRSAPPRRRRACLARFVRRLMTRSPFPPVPIRHLMPPRTLALSG